MLGSVKGSSYGSTQATVLALQAIIKYQQEYVSTDVNGTFNLYIDNTLIESLSTETTTNLDFTESIMTKLEDQVFLNSLINNEEHEIKIELVQD